MCFQTQLVLEFTKTDALWNKRILEEVRKQVHYRNANVFARYPWPVITAAEPDALHELQCGFVPRYIPDPAGFLKQYSTYNAKSEEVYEKRTFAKVAKKGRRPHTA